MRRRLEEDIARYGSVVVGFSAGVDSSVVAAAAHAALGNRALAVTAITETITEEDLDLARHIVRATGVRHQWVEYNELEVEGYAENPSNRCYFCKDALYVRLAEVARGEGGLFCWTAQTPMMPGIIVRAARQRGSTASVRRCWNWA